MRRDASKVETRSGNMSTIPAGANKSKVGQVSVAVGSCRGCDAISSGMSCDAVGSHMC